MQMKAHSSGVVSKNMGKRHLRGAGINLLYVPALVLLIVFVLYPLLSGMYLSFTNWNGYNIEKSFVGLANYAMLFKDPNFKTVLINTMIYGVGCTLIQQILGLGLALLLNAKIKAVNTLRAIIYLPALISPVIMGTMYYFIFQYQQGALNTIATALGGQKILWFNQASTSVIIIVLANSLQFVGISMIIYLAGLQGMDKGVVEAAQIDGATGLRMFWNITLPLLQPAFYTSVVYNLIGGLKLFDIIKVLTGGGPGYSTNSVSTYLSIVYYDQQNAGYSAAMGVVLFLLIAVFTGGLNKVMAKLNWGN